jgi:hypothetical protein
VTVSICQDDFQGALTALGYAASGLRREFRLTRGPDLHPNAGLAQGLAVYVSPANAANCTVDANCPSGSGQVCQAGRCATKMPVALTPVSTGADYVKCDTGGLRNMVRFEGTSVPDPLSTVEVCYEVLPSFQNSCP